MRTPDKPRLQQVAKPLEVKLFLVLVLQAKHGQPPWPESPPGFGVKMSIYCPIHKDAGGADARTQTHMHACMRAYMYVCMCICIYIIYIMLLVYVFVYVTCIYTHTHAWLHEQTSRDTDTLTKTHTHTHTHLCTCVCLRLSMSPGCRARTRCSLPLCRSAHVWACGAYSSIKCPQAFVALESDHR